MKSLFASGFTLLILAFAASAQTNQWTKPTSGAWEESYWSLGHLPGANQDVAIDNYGWKAVAISENTTVHYPASLSLNNLLLDGPADSMNTLLLNWAKLTVPLVVNSNLTIGVCGALVSHYSALKAANVDVSGSASFMDYATEQIDNLSLWSNGSVGLTNGVMTCSNLVFHDGTFTQSGGTHLVQAMAVPHVYRQYTGASGEYDLQGGTLVSQELSLGDVQAPFGPDGRGVVWQTGGIHTNGGMSMSGYSHPGGSSFAGRYMLDGGLLVSSSVYIDGGVYIQNGGTNIIQEFEIRGGSYGSLRGGELVISNASTYMDTYIGGRFEQTGGKLTVLGRLLIGGGGTGGSPAYSINGGTLVAPLVQIDPGAKMEMFSDATLVTSEIRLGGGFSLGSGTITNAVLTFAGGILSPGGYLDCRFGKIQLSSGGGINLYTAHTLSFQDSHDLDWSGVLRIRYWSSSNAHYTNHIFVGTDSQGLNADQLSRVIFESPNGLAGDYAAAILPTGELVPAGLYDYNTLIYNYTITNGTATITGCSGTNTYANLPDTIQGFPVTCIATQAFAYRTFTWVSIPSTVTNIEEGAFLSCYRLTSITLPRGLIVIGNYAFAYCSGLTNVDLGGSLRTIGKHAFAGGRGIKFVKLPDTVTDIGEEAFAGSGLTSVDFGTNLKTIGEGAFGSCNLTNLTLPDTMVSIGEGAFNYCTSLAQVHLGNGPMTIGPWAFDLCTVLTNLDLGHGLTSIDRYAIENCIGLTRVTIPASVTNIGTPAFLGCTSLVAVAVDPDSAWYTSVDGTLFNKAQTRFLKWPEAKTGSCALPNTVTTIGESAFYYSPGLENVTLSDSLKSIEDDAFWACFFFTNLVIPNSATNIGRHAFDGCTNLVCVTIPSSVVVISDWAFYGCPLTAVYFEGDPPSVTWGTFPSNPTLYYLPGTSGWAETFTNCPTALWQPCIDTNALTFGVHSNRFGFSMNWARGRTVVIEARTNLLQGAWVPIATNMLTNGSSYFSDSVDCPAKCYRVRSP